MNEEDLQELKEWHENDEKLHQFQIDKLIEVVESFNYIQKENVKLSILLRDTQSKYIESLKAIESMKEEIEYVLHSDKSKDVKKHYLENAVRYADEALESEIE